MSQNIAQLREDCSTIGHELVGARREEIRRLTEVYAQHERIANEISGHFEQMEDCLRSGFRDVAEAIRWMEDSMASYLSEIGWVLGQMDDRLAELVRLVKFPRRTEVAELVTDGVRALATGNFDDAEACLLEAVTRKRTDFQAHTNLGFLYIHKNDGEKALLHFQKAVDYVPQEEEQTDRRINLKRFALANLARAHFAMGRFESAFQVMEQATKAGGEPEHLYHRSVYGVLAAEVRISEQSDQ